MAARLSADRFAAARAFMHAQAEPLELALWRHGFEGEAGQAVLDALASFQNPDGGFGHGLEADIASAASSAIATSVGLRHLRRAGAPSDHPMVAKATQWLAANIQDGVWPIVDAHVDDAPHAPWWAYDAELPDRWQGFRFNPTAEILAHLCHFRTGAPAELIAAAEDRMRRTVAEFDAITGAYDLRCAALLAEAPGVPDDLCSPLRDLLIRSVVAHDAVDEHAPALDLAPRPDSFLAEALKDRLEMAAVALIEGQTPDGGWSPFWDWGFVDEAAWARAKKAWRGSLTRLAVEALAAHGRVDR